MRPYSKIKTTMCDFNLNDEIAIYSEPIGVVASKSSKKTNEIDFADEFVSQLNQNVNIDTFFEPVTQ